MQEILEKSCILPHFLYLCRRILIIQIMRITIINSGKGEKRYSREELDRRLAAMGYKYHKLTQGAAYRMLERSS